MLFRKLGDSNIEASVVGLGTWAIGGWMWGGTDEQQSIEAIQTALDCGVNLIDTAPIYGYGRSEEIVGKAIAGRREGVVLATKCGLRWDTEKGEFFGHANEEGVTLRPSSRRIHRYLHPDSIREELERSLKRLKTDHLDLYQTHWQEATTPIEDTMACLVKLKDEGKIRAIGVSNVTAEQLDAYGPIDSDQELFSMLDRGIETGGLLARCREKGVSMLAYSPLAQGLLTGKLGPERTFGDGDLRRRLPRFRVENRRRAAVMLDRFQPFADRHAITLTQLAIAWTFSRPGITFVLCGARNAAQAMENAQAGDVTLSDEELAEIDQIVSASDVK